MFHKHCRWLIQQPLLIQFITWQLLLRMLQKQWFGIASIFDARYLIRMTRGHCSNLTTHAWALVIPEQHPPHIGFIHPKAEQFGRLKVHRDGTRSCYVADPAGNPVEVLAPMT